MSAFPIEAGTEFPITSALRGNTGRLFLVVLERGADGWGAYVPDLPGVVAAGDTEDEVRALIADAVTFHIDGLRLAGEPIPESSSGALWVVG